MSNARRRRGYMRRSGERRRGSGNRGGFGMAGTGKRRAHKGKPVKFKKPAGFTLRKQIRRLNSINLYQLERIDGSVIHLKNTKILGRGSISKKLEVFATQFSTTAKEKIEAAGGKASVEL